LISLKRRKTEGTLTFKIKKQNLEKVKKALETIDADQMAEDNPIVLGNILTISKMQQKINMFRSVMIAQLLIDLVMALEIIHLIRQ
jgi:hypothetical protein